MIPTGAQLDLVVLVADANMEFALRGILQRGGSFLARSPTHDVFVHPERDPGCLLRGPDFLRGVSRRYRHALVLFDRDGCGREEDSRAVVPSG